MKAIRYQEHELEALSPDSLLFCLASSNWTIDVMVEVLEIARSRIEKVVARGDSGFWHVYRDGKLRKIWQ